MKDFLLRVALSSEPQIQFKNFTSSFGRKILPETVQCLQYNQFYCHSTRISLIYDAGVAIVVVVS